MVVSILLLQYLPYYCSMHCIAAGLITTVPTLLQQHQLQSCKCHHFYCRHHAYYLSIILVNAVQALLLHLKLCCCTVSLLVIGIHILRVCNIGLQMQQNSLIQAL